MKRILLAYDGTPAADTALSTTVALAKALKAEVGVVSVVRFTRAVPRSTRGTTDPFTRSNWSAPVGYSGKMASSRYSSSQPAIRPW